MLALLLAAEDFRLLLFRLVEAFDFDLLVVRADFPAARALVPLPLVFERREVADFFAAELRDVVGDLERELVALDFEDRLEAAAFDSARRARGSIGLPLAAAFPARAPTTPPTTAPTGPATLPRTAPVAAPAVCFEIGGMSMFSDPLEFSLDFSLVDLAIGLSLLQVYVAYTVIVWRRVYSRE